MLRYSALIISACFAVSAEAQEKPDDGALRAVIAQKQALEAQMKRIKSVLSYQSEIIALGKQDPNAAYSARRSNDQCEQETLGGLCAHLKATYK